MDLDFYAYTDTDIPMVTRRRTRGHRTRGQLFPTYIPLTDGRPWLLADAWGTLLRDAQGFVRFSTEQEALDHARATAPPSRSVGQDDGTS